MSVPAAVMRDAPETAHELRGSVRIPLPDGTVLAWLIPAGVSAHWQARPAICRLPGAAGALCGVTYWLARLAPVFDVARWLAPRKNPGALDHIVLLGLPRGPAAFRVQGAPELVHVEASPHADARSPAPDSLRAFLRPRRLASGAVVHEFAVEAWLEQARSGAAAPTRYEETT